MKQNPVVVWLTLDSRSPDLGAVLRISFGVGLVVLIIGVWVVFNNLLAWTTSVQQEPLQISLILLLSACIYSAMLAGQAVTRKYLESDDARLLRMSTLSGRRIVFGLWYGAHMQVRFLLPLLAGLFPVIVLGASTNLAFDVSSYSPSNPAMPTDRLFAGSMQAFVAMVLDLGVTAHRITSLNFVMYTLNWWMLYTISPLFGVLTALIFRTYFPALLTSFLLALILIVPAVPVYPTLTLSLGWVYPLGLVMFAWMGFMLLLIVEQNI